MALAAIEGLITVKHPSGTYGRTWRITAKGLALLNSLHTTQEIIPNDATAQGAGSD